MEVFEDIEKNKQRSGCKPEKVGQSEHVATCYEVAEQRSEIDNVIVKDLRSLIRINDNIVWWMKIMTWKCDCNLIVLFLML